MTGPSTGSTRDVLAVSRRLAGFALGRFLLGAFLWLPVSVIPLGSGLLLKAVFDAVDSGPVDTGRAWLLCAAFAATELVRSALLLTAFAYGVWWWDAAATVLRGNLLRSLLTAPGTAADRLPGSSGEALGRLRADVGGMVDFVDEFVPLTGAVLFAAGAFTVMARIDPLLTGVLVLPMLAVAVLGTTASGVVKRLHASAQQGAATVTGHLGEVFANVLALKTAGAEPAALQRLREHNRARRRAAVADRLATDLLDAGTGAGVEVGIGLVLLLSAGAMRRGDFTVGDLALFTTYVTWLTALPRAIGSVLFRVPQARVSVQRLTRLLAPGQGVADLGRDGRVWFGATPAPAAPVPPRHPDRLERLTVRGLSVAFEGGRGLRDVDLDLTAGTFTVLTGATGAGKTTLVRALLGLLRPDAGTVEWNGRPVADPGTFLVPARVAYAGQAPRLFSATVAENVLLGRPGDDLADALRLAVLEEDVARMPEGLLTPVGARGVRLSGGQVQRMTAARALARRPDLLVLDDLSSALDGETEARLWDRLAAAVADGTGPGALLVVSHRRAALERADRVVVLDGGAVVGAGAPADLLRDCEPLRRIWAAREPERGFARP
jgi:ATP-binding cassette subfamily B protein